MVGLGRIFVVGRDGPAAAEHLTPQRCEVVDIAKNRYADDVVGIDRFGASAPGSVALDRLGINVDHVVERADALLAD